MRSHRRAIERDMKEEEKEERKRLEGWHMNNDF